jgi:hypothetical protein
MMERLKAPFPYAGGKSSIADVVWKHLGDDATNYVEPFAGSLAVLLARPQPFNGVETCNDISCYITNFWRAVRYDPDQVAYWADYPVSELDLHANHRWLVLSEDAVAFREKLRADPDYYDSKVAGRWVNGLCCWIGSGWCEYRENADSERRPFIGASHQGGGKTGVHRKVPNAEGRGDAAAQGGGNMWEQMPAARGSGLGVNALSEQLPKLSGFGAGWGARAGGPQTAQPTSPPHRRPAARCPPRGG